MISIFRHSLRRAVPAIDRNRTGLRNHTYRLVSSKLVLTVFAAGVSPWRVRNSRWPHGKLIVCSALDRKSACRLARRHRDLMPLINFRKLLDGRFTTVPRQLAY